MGKLLRFLFIIALKKNMFLTFYIFGHCNVIYRCYFILIKSTSECNFRHFISKNFTQGLKALKWVV